MNYQEFQWYSIARAAEAKKLAIEAIKEHLPKGYILSDDPKQMFGNALFRIQSLKTDVGTMSLQFLHNLTHRTDRIDGILTTTPSIESVKIVADVFGGRVWESDYDWGIDGAVESKVYSKDDMAAAVREVISQALTQKPFVNLEWKRDEHDSHKHHLFVGAEKMGSAWKSGSMWGTTIGAPCETLGNAKVRVEGAAMGMIKTRHDERLAGLGDQVKGNAQLDTQMIEEAVPPKEYRYAMVNRPFGIGTAPKDGFVRCEDRPVPGVDHYDRARNGVSVYNRKLTDLETKQFEMAYMAGGEDLGNIASAVADSLGRYAKQYVEMSQDDTDQFEHIVEQHLKSTAQGYVPSVGRIGKFADLVLDNLKVKEHLVPSPEQTDEHTEACVSEGIFSGRVISVKNGVVVQNINRAGDTARHDASKLSDKVEVDSVVDIKYQDGLAVVESTTRALEQGR